MFYKKDTRLVWVSIFVLDNGDCLPIDRLKTCVLDIIGLVEKYKASA